MARPWFEGRKQRGTEIQDAEGTNEAGLLTRLVSLVLVLLLESLDIQLLASRRIRNISSVMARPWFEGRKQRGTYIQQDAGGPNEVGQLAQIHVRVVMARGKNPALTYTQRRERCDGRVKEPAGTRHNVIEQGR